jgi:uncharacterized protein YceK
MKLLLITALFILTGCTAIPECQYTDQGKEASYPCTDARVQQWSDTERWGILKTKIKLVGHGSVSETQRVCKGEKACKLGDTYHTTNGDIAALVKLAPKK